MARRIDGRSTLLERVFGDCLAYCDPPSGQFVMAAAAGINPAAYSVAELGSGPTDDGDLRVVVNTGARLVSRTFAGVPPAGELAVAAGRVALVPLAPDATYYGTPDAANHRGATCDLARSAPESRSADESSPSR